MSFLNRIGQKLEGLKEDLSDLKDASGLSKEELGEKLSLYRNKLKSAQEDYAQFAEEKKDGLAQEGSTIKKEWMKKKEALERELEQRKYANEKEKARAKLDYALEYAEDAANRAVIAADEANVAYMVAQQMQRAFQEKYKNEVCD